jgi:hypothetical protein
VGSVDRVERVSCDAPAGKKCGNQVLNAEPTRSRAKMTSRTPRRLLRPDSRPDPHYVVPQTHRPRSLPPLVSINRHT